MKKKTRQSHQPKRARGPQAIKDVMAGLMASRGYAQVEATDEYQSAWRDIAKEFADDSCAGTIRRGVLQVIVRNSAVMQELTFRQTALLNELSGRLPKRKITGIRFRVGEID